MSATDRILIWMAKALDLKEFGELMMDLGDMPTLKQALCIIKKGARDTSTNQRLQRNTPTEASGSGAAR